MRDGDDDALPNAATGCEAQAMEEHAAEDIKHFRPTTVRLPAARSLPLGLADGGHAALRGRAGRTLTWSSAGSTARVYLAKYVTKRDEEPDEEDGPMRMPCLA